MKSITIQCIKPYVLSLPGVLWKMSLVNSAVNLSDRSASGSAVIRQLVPVGCHSWQLRQPKRLMEGYRYKVKSNTPI